MIYKLIKDNGPVKAGELYESVVEHHDEMYAASGVVKSGTISDSILFNATEYFELVENE